jgi:hypothetical protein
MEHGANPEMKGWTVSKAGAARLWCCLFWGDTTRLPVQKAYGCTFEMALRSVSNAAGVGVCPV